MNKKQKVVYLLKQLPKVHFTALCLIIVIIYLNTIPEMQEKGLRVFLTVFNIALIPLVILMLISVIIWVALYFKYRVLKN